MKFNKIIRGILFGLLLFIAVFAMGAFYETSFNIRLWKEDTREVISILGGILLIAGTFIASNWDALSKIR